MSKQSIERLNRSPLQIPPKPTTIGYVRRSVEDKRNTAQEDLIIQESSLAKAIVRLRNETGTLVRIEGDGGKLDIESFTTIPDSIRQE